MGSDSPPAPKLNAPPSKHANSKEMRKKNYGSTNSTEVQYDVVKKHHRHRWLRQERVLEINSTHIYNCKPPQGRGALPNITKQFSLTSVTSIGIKGKKAFCLHIRGDHVYYYYSPRAIEIAHEIQRYVAAANAVDMLLDANDTRRDALMHQLITGSIPLPGGQPQNASPYAAHSPRAARLKSDIVSALRKGFLDGSNELRELSRTWSEKAAEDKMDLLQLRSAMSTIRDLCAAHVLERSRLSISEGTSLFPFILSSVECVLQQSVIKPNFDKIIDSLRQDAALMERQKRFDKRRSKLRGKSAEFFDVPRELRGLNYSLVLHNFEILSNCKCPSDVMDQIVNVAACLCLTIHVAARLPKVRKTRRGKQRNTSKKVGSNNVAPAPSGNSNPTTDADPTTVQKVENEKESGVFRATVSYLRRDGATPQTVLDSNPNSNTSVSTQSKVEVKKNTATDVTGERSVTLSAEQANAPSSPTPTPPTSLPQLSRKLVRSASPLSLSVTVNDAAMREIVLNPSIDTSDDEEFSLADFESVCSHTTVASLGRFERGGLSGDDTIPLFIHLLCEVNVPDVCLILRAVELLHESTDSSEREYYFTTFTAAVEMICSCTLPPAASSRRTIKVSGDAEVSVNGGIFSSGDDTL